MLDDATPRPVAECGCAITYDLTDEARAAGGLFRFHPCATHKADKDACRRVIDKLLLDAGFDAVKHERGPADA